MSTVTPNLGLFKYNITTDANVAFNINTALNNNWDKIDAAVYGSSRNIGEIVTSTIPIVNASLHLLDGALIQGGGIYSDFVSYMANLYGDGTDIPNYFCSQVDWETAVSTYGVCGKFVYNSTNNTVRLPKITGIIEGTTDLTALGDLVEAGLPNITGTFSPWAEGNSLATGAFYVVSNNQKGTNQGGDSDNTLFGFDASRSSSVYGNSNTIQPQTIKAFYYIVIANAVKNGISVDIDEIATDLNNKADLSDMVEVQCIIETYSNGTSWYRVYSDGWCEQGGRTTNTGAETITFLKPFIDANYYGSACPNYDARTDGINAYVGNLTATTMTIYNKQYGTSSTSIMNWYACGYII